MHDLKYIRDNPDDFDKAMARRGLEAQSKTILELDEARRGVQTERNLAGTHKRQWTR